MDMKRYMDMQMTLLTTYSAVGDTYQEREKDLEEYTDWLSSLSYEELEKHYNESLIQVTEGEQI